MPSPQFVNGERYKKIKNDLKNDADKILNISFAGTDCSYNDDVPHFSAMSAICLDSTAPRAGVFFDGLGYKSYNMENYLGLSVAAKSPVNSIEAEGTKGGKAQPITGISSNEGGLASISGGDAAISKSLASIAGYGSKTALLRVVNLLKALDEDGSLPSTVNLGGHSRGGVTAIALANEIYIHFGMRIKVNIAVTEPVPGPTPLEDYLLTVIPPNVKSLTAVYATHGQGPQYTFLRRQNEKAIQAKDQGAYIYLEDEGKLLYKDKEKLHEINITAIEKVADLFNGPVKWDKVIRPLSLFDAVVTKNGGQKPFLQGNPGESFINNQIIALDPNKFVFASNKTEADIIAVPATDHQSIRKSKLNDYKIIQAIQKMNNKKPALNPNPPIEPPKEEMQGVGARKEISYYLKRTPEFYANNPIIEDAVNNTTEKYKQNLEREPERLNKLNAKQRRFHVKQLAKIGRIACFSNHCAYAELTELRDSILQSAGKIRDPKHPVSALYSRHNVPWDDSFKGSHRYYVTHSQSAFMSQVNKMIRNTDNNPFDEKWFKLYVELKNELDKVKPEKPNQELTSIPSFISELATKVNSDFAQAGKKFFKDEPPTHVLKLKKIINGEGFRSKSSEAQLNLVVECLREAKNSFSPTRRATTAQFYGDYLAWGLSLQSSEKKEIPIKKENPVDIKLVG